MSIRGKVYLTVTLLSLVSGMVIVVAIASSFTVSRELTYADRVQEIAKSVAELSLLTESYLAHGEERIETQWRSRAARIEAAIADPDIHERVGSVELIFQSLTRSFSSLEQLNQELTDPDHTDQERERLSLVIDRVGTRMRMDSQNLLSRVFLLAGEARGRATTLQQRSSILVTSLAAILIFITLAGALAMTITTTGRLRLLLKGTQAIGRGQLDYRVKPAGQDEIGLLAEGFNSMASNLETLVQKHQELNLELEERVRERTRALEAANKEMEAFTYSVSHDLRAPLRAVDGFARFLDEDYGTRLDAEGQRFISVIRSNIQQMDTLITALLALSRITRSDLSLSPLDMHSIATSMYNEAAPEGVRRQFEVEIHPLAEAHGDASLLKQVWFNLISNALKYSADSREKRIEIGSTTDGREHVYYVKDHGVGFDPAYAHKLFEVFQRLHRSDQFEGTGVGLAIVERIVRRHGGRVWARGEEHKGATFYFSMPIHQDLQTEEGG